MRAPAYKGRCVAHEKRAPGPMYELPPIHPLQPLRDASAYREKSYTYWSALTRTVYDYSPCGLSFVDVFVTETIIIAVAPL
jgi:hypothetical protein